MKKLLSTLCALVCFAASPMCLVSAQEYVAPPVTISKDKVKMDGKTYYSHVIVERQTLYSIAKAYGVDMEAIYAANPTLRETGLRKNAIILIPAVEESTQTAAEEKKEEKSERKASREEKKQTKKTQKDYFTHTVKWYEDLDVISEKYGVPVRIIMEYNGLKDRKLKNRQQLRIPTDPDSLVLPAEPGSTPEAGTAPAGQNETVAPGGESQVTPKATVKESEEPGIFQAEFWKEKFPFFSDGSKQVNALLMLPFNAQGDEPSSISMDFYSGVLLAAREMGEKGINVDLSVYDTYGDVLPITQERLEKSDFVIGPPSQSALVELLAKSPEDTFIISPLDTRTSSLTEQYSNFIQVPMSTSAQYADLMQWIIEDKGDGDSVVIIFEKGSRDMSKEAAFQNALDSCGLKYSPFSYSILEGRNILSSLSRLMTKTGTNRIMVASESEAFVNDVVRNVNLLIHNKYDIVLYGASRIRSYETIDVANLHQANLHSSMAYYIDYDNPQVRSFLMKYRALFNTEPSQMAFQGYDIMYYFCEMCSRYGKMWPNMLSGKTPMLMSDFSFTRGGKGLERNVLRRVVYGEDYSVKLVD